MFPAAPSALSSHRARGAQPWPHAARRRFGLGTGTGLDLRVQWLADAGCSYGFVPSEGAGRRGPLTWKSRVSTHWDWHYWARLKLQAPQTSLLPLAFHNRQSQVLDVIPATASPVHSTVGMGFPVALQRNSAVCPGCTVSCGGWIEIVGADGVPEADGGGERTHGQNISSDGQARASLLLSVLPLKPLMAVCP